MKKLLHLFITIHLLATSHVSSSMTPFEIPIELQQRLEDLARDKELMSKCQDTDMILNVDPKNVERINPLLILAAISAIMGTTTAAVNIFKVVRRHSKNEAIRALPDIVAKAKKTTLKGVLLGAGGVGGPVGFGKHRTIKGRETKEDLRERCSQLLTQAQSIYRELVKADRKSKVV